MAHIKKLLLLTLLILSVAIAGCADSNPATAPKSPGVGTNPSSGQQGTGQSTATGQNMMTITVYHATQDAMYLVAEKHTVAKNDHPAKTAVELLLNEPADKQFVRVLPPGAKLRNLTVKDHIAYVDFDDKLMKNHVGGSAAERLTVAAIVNTLTEFPDVQKVQILVEGKVVETLTGHMDVSQPLSRSESIIKKK